MGCCCSCFKMGKNNDSLSELNHELLPCSNVEQRHYEIYNKYLDNITFIKPLSNNNNVYKVKYQGNISILRIIYRTKDFIRELNVAKKRVNIENCKVSEFETEETFDDSTVVNGGLIIYRFISGIDLWKFLVDKNDKLSESLTKRIIRSILIPLKSLHDNNIIHGDIKLENIICKHNNPEDCYLIDLGMSTLISQDMIFKNIDYSCGTIPFVAPEIVISRKIGLGSDIWSLGCLMYLLLFFKHPFNNNPTLFNDAILSCSTQLADLKAFSLGRISDPCIDLIFKMLEPDISCRININEILKHPWIIED